MTMTTRRGMTLAIALGCVVLLLAACGSDDPVPRSFDNEEPEASAEAPQLPARVPSNVKLTFKHGKFRADVSAQRDYCLDKRTVVVMELGKKHDVKVVKITTDEDGFGSLAEKKAAGKFVGKLMKEPSAEYGDVSVCLGATSKTLKV